MASAAHSVLLWTTTLGPFKSDRYRVRMPMGLSPEALYVPSRGQKVFGVATRVKSVLLKLAL